MAKEGGTVAAETLAAVGIIMGAKADKIATRVKLVDTVRIAFPLVSRDRCEYRGATKSGPTKQRTSRGVGLGSALRRAISRSGSSTLSDGGNTPRGDFIQPLKPRLSAAPMSSCSVGRPVARSARAAEKTCIRLEFHGFQPAPGWPGARWRVQAV